MAATEHNVALMVSPIRKGWCLLTRVAAKDASDEQGDAASAVYHKIISEDEAARVVADATPVYADPPARRSATATREGAGRRRLQHSKSAVVDAASVQPRHALRSPGFRTTRRHATRSPASATSRRPVSAPRRRRSRRPAQQASTPQKHQGQGDRQEHAQSGASHHRQQGTQQEDQAQPGALRNVLSSWRDSSRSRSFRRLRTGIDVAETAAVARQQQQQQQQQQQRQQQQSRAVDGRGKGGGSQERRKLKPAARAAWAAVRMLKHSNSGKKRRKQRPKLPTSFKHIMPDGADLGKKLRMRPHLLLDEQHQTWALRHLRLRATGPALARRPKEEKPKAEVDPDAHLTPIERVRKRALLAKILCDSLAYQRSKLRLRKGADGEDVPPRPKAKAKAKSALARLAAHPKAATGLLKLTLAASRAKKQP